MKRFIDLRGQHTLHRFAWWDTVRDCFEMFDGDHAWCTWDEFVESMRAESRRYSLNLESVISRYKRLCPAWTTEPDPDDDYETDTVHRPT